MKKCSSCKEIKPVTEFYNHKKQTACKQNYCKQCSTEKFLAYKRTKDGLVTIIYNSQKLNSKQRGHLWPTYSKEGLRDWMFSQKAFHELYDNWKASGFKKELRPSCDRLDDYKAYYINNLRIVTWEENARKAISDMVNGINNKQNQGVIGINLRTSKSRKFHSLHDADRKTPAYFQNIWKCLIGERMSAGGYTWKCAEN